LHVGLKNDALPDVSAAAEGNRVVFQTGDMSQTSEKDLGTESLVSFRTSQGVDLRAVPVRVSRFAVVLEVYDPSAVLRASEVLTEFRIIGRGRALYSGRATIRSVINSGLTIVCEATLDEASWMEVEFTPDSGASRNGKLREEYGTFLLEWQKLYRVDSEYKLIIADMQSYFWDLRLWLDQLELGIRSAPSGDRGQYEHIVAEDVAFPIVQSVNELFARFEHIAGRLDPELLPVHRNYMRRQLHPLVMCAPFPSRAYFKPLGYAGDYEMVNMMARNACEGASLFAKVINTWFLRQPPAEAHRNRIRYLVDKLLAETVRATSAGREPRIFNVACGPAQEIQVFLANQPVSNRAVFTLLDFNEETLEYAATTLGQIKARHGRTAQVQIIKKSVHHLLKESGRTVPRAADQKYDMVYCAGLFDYLSDPVCRRLMDLMYEWVAPGGLLIATNVEPSNPLRNGMEHLLDWHLIYRTAAQFRSLQPRQASADDCLVTCDNTGFNLFLEVRKPISHAA
jgi:extracellular factor (EF) 3-hydroxypalmitic acid methyl ester biosynthesis protein